MVNNPPSPDEIKAVVIKFHLLGIHAEDSSVQLEAAHPFTRTLHSEIREIDSGK